MAALEADLAAHRAVGLNGVPCNAGLWDVTETAVIFRLRSGLVEASVSNGGGRWTNLEKGRSSERLLPIGPATSVREALALAERFLEEGEIARRMPLERFLDTLGLRLACVVAIALDREIGFPGIGLHEGRLFVRMRPESDLVNLMIAAADAELDESSFVLFDPSVLLDITSVRDRIKTAWDRMVRAHHSP